MRQELGERSSEKGRKGERPRRRGAMCSKRSRRSEGGRTDGKFGIQLGNAVNSFVAPSTTMATNPVDGEGSQTQDFREKAAKFED